MVTAQLADKESTKIEMRIVLSISDWRLVREAIKHLPTAGTSDVFIGIDSALETVLASFSGEL